MSVFVNQITADNWSNEVTNDEVIISPTVADLHRVIDLLDADVRTSVFLYGDNGAYLAIGGGNGQYIVYVAPSDKQFWNLTSNEADESEMISLVVGGQESEYDARQIVTKDIAIKAAESFFTKGDIDPSLHWNLQQC
jgi:hypothetical protein